MPGVIHIVAFRLSRRLIAAAALAPLVAISCDDTTSPDLNGLEMVVTASAISVQPAETVFIRVVVTNTSNEPVLFHSALVGCPVSVEIQGPGVINYYRQFVTCDAPAADRLPIPLVLQPGDSIVGSGGWPGVTYVSSA